MYFYIGSIDRRTVHSCDLECFRGRALSVVLVVVRLLDDARPFGEVEGAAHGDGSGGPPGEQNALQLGNPIPLIFLQNVLSLFNDICTGILLSRTVNQMPNNCLCSISYLVYGTQPTLRDAS